jgi:hypothetical protein
LREENCFPELFILLSFAKDKVEEVKENFTGLIILLLSLSLLFSSIEIS